MISQCNTSLPIFPTYTMTSQLQSPEKCVWYIILKKQENISSENIVNEAENGQLETGMDLYFQKCLPNTISLQTFSFFNGEDKLIIYGPIIL